jgi:thioredoxin 1
MFLRLFCLALFGSLSAVAAEGVQSVTEQNFQQEIKSGVVLVDFYGAWCGPCKRLAPELDKAAASLKKGQKIVKVNIDQAQTLASQYKVSAVPTMILFKNGQEVDRTQGYQTEGDILEFINSAQ